MNNNGLEGMACPSCKQDDRINVAYTATTTVYDDGTEDSGHSDMEWGDDSVADCPECGYSGYWSDFHIDEDTDKVIVALANWDTDRVSTVGFAPLGLTISRRCWIYTAPATKRNVALFNRAMGDMEAGWLNDAELSDQGVEVNEVQAGTKV